jgi:ACS family tartrate transporter-like MFS transporter
MVTWGVVSGAMALVGGEKSFYITRFLLGAAEAGFFPGVVVYLMSWLPSAYRARLLGIFYVAIPVAVVIGAIICTPLLKLEGVLGLHGWQWLFVIQAIPAVVLGVCFWSFMQDSPADATWLTVAERADLLARIEDDRIRNTPARRETTWQAFSHPRVVKLSCIYFGMNLAGVGLVLFLPQIVAGFGAGSTWSPLITGIPYLAAAVFLPFWGRLSDRGGQRRLQAAFGALCVCLGLGLCVTVSNPVIMLALITVAACGVYAFAPPFWVLSSTLLTGSAAAAGLAIINSVGNLSGFLGPFLVGWIRDSTGSFTIGLLTIAVGPALAAIALTVLKTRQFSR